MAHNAALFSLQAAHPSASGKAGIYSSTLQEMLVALLSLLEVPRSSWCRIARCSTNEEIASKIHFAIIIINGGGAVALGGLRICAITITRAKE